MSNKNKSLIIILGILTLCSVLFYFYDDREQPGVVIKLKSNSEIRIQYDQKKVFITRNDVKPDYAQTKYYIDGPELNDFFKSKIDKELFS